MVKNKDNIPTILTQIPTQCDDVEYNLKSEILKNATQRSEESNMMNARLIHIETVVTALMASAGSSAAELTGIKDNQKFYFRTILACVALIITGLIGSLFWLTTHITEINAVIEHLVPIIQN